MPKAAQAVRDTNIHLRIAAAQRALIDQAAGIVRKTRTGFILDAATREAENAILDQRVFILSPDQLRALHEAMDTPPAASESLRELMSRQPGWAE